MTFDDPIYKNLEQFGSQCLYAASLAREYYIKKPEEVENIVVVGVGNAAIGGDLLKSYVNIDKAVFVNRGYNIPEFVNKKSLVFIVSYSGETQETINAYKGAISKRAQVICITSGGKLGQLCRINNTEQVIVPKGVTPRIALGYMFIPILIMLDNAGIIQLNDEIEKMVKCVKNPLIKRKGAELASRLVKKVPLIYTSSRFRSIGLRWKYMLNETAKVLAFTGEFPDMGYNEINGFMNPYADYEVIIINEEGDYSKVQRHMKLAKEIMKRKVRVTEISIKGDCMLSKLFSTILLGDWTSYFLALKTGEDPLKSKFTDIIKKNI